MKPGIPRLFAVALATILLSSSGGRAAAPGSRPSFAKASEDRPNVLLILTDAAIGFLEKQRDDPFFCYLAYNAPHTPLQVPDAYFDKYKARGFDDRIAAIYGMVDSLDENIGRLLERLEE